VLNESWLLQQPTLIPPSGERNAKCWRHQMVIVNMNFCTNYRIHNGRNSHQFYIWALALWLLGPIAKKFLLFILMK